MSGRRVPRADLHDELPREPLLMLRREIDADAPGAPVDHAEDVRAEGRLEEVPRGPPRTRAGPRSPGMTTRSASESRRVPGRPVEDQPHESVVLGRRARPADPARTGRSGRTERPPAPSPGSSSRSRRSSPDAGRGPGSGTRTRRARAGSRRRPRRARRRRRMARAGRQDRARAAPAHAAVARRRSRRSRVLPPPTAPVGVAQVRHRPPILGAGPGIRQRRAPRDRDAPATSPALQRFSGRRRNPRSPCGRKMIIRMNRIPTGIR